MYTLYIAYHLCYVSLVKYLLLVIWTVDCVISIYYVYYNGILTYILRYFPYVYYMYILVKHFDYFWTKIVYVKQNNTYN